MKPLVVKDFGRRDFFLLGSAVVLGLASLFCFLAVDQVIFNYLSRTHPLSWCNNYWIQQFTLLGKAWFLIWLALAWYLAFGRQKPLVCILLALAMVALAVMPLKFLVMRARPYQVLEWMQTGVEGTVCSNLSFPSGDTAAVFSAAVVLVYFLISSKVLSIVLSGLVLFVAACVGFLRVAMMAHFPSDVFAGAGCAFLAGWLAVFIDRKLEGKGIWRFRFPLWLAAVIVVLMPVCYNFNDLKQGLIVLLQDKG